MEEKERSDGHCGCPRNELDRSLVFRLIAQEKAIHEDILTASIRPSSGEEKRRWVELLPDSGDRRCG